MYGQSSRVVRRGGVGPLQFGRASLCWARSVTFHSHRSVGISQVRCVHLAMQYSTLPRPWLPLRMESSLSRDLHTGWSVCRSASPDGEETAKFF